MESYLSVLVDVRELIQADLISLPGANLITRIFIFIERKMK